MKYWRTILCASALGLGGLAVWAADSWKNNTTRRGAANALPLEAVASPACTEPPPTLQQPTISGPGEYVQRTQEPTVVLELPAPPVIGEPPMVVKLPGGPVTLEPLPKPRLSDEPIVPHSVNVNIEAKVVESPAEPPKPELTPPMNLPEPPLPSAPPKNEIPRPMLPSLPVPEMPAAADLPIPPTTVVTGSSTVKQPKPMDSVRLPLPDNSWTLPVPSTHSPETLKPFPVVKTSSHPLKLSVRAGGTGAPRFEVRDGDILLLKVSCDNVEMQTAQDKGAANPGVIATGNVRLHGSGLDGTCDSLSVVTANGEVMLKGNIKLTCYRAGSSSEVMADQMRFSLLRGDAAAKPRALSTVKPASHTDR